MASMPTALTNVRGTALLTNDSRETYRQKIARITLDSMVQFVGLLDADGTVLEINQVALDAVGIKLSDVEGKPFWTTFWWQVSEEINATLRESIRRAAQGEFVRWDTEIYGRASGKETIIIDASLMPVRDEQGKVVFIVAEGRDITEKKAYEREIARQREELAELDKRFGTASDITRQKQVQENLHQTLSKLSEQARLLDLSNDAIMVRDSSDHITYWNRGATEIYGYTREEAIGRVTHELFASEFPEPLDRITEKLYRDERWNGELIHTRKDGVKIVVASRWALDRDANGLPVAILETNSDITQRKQSEEALRRSEKLAAVGRLAATVAHEINNPLESITNLLYLAKRDPGMSGNARQHLVLADQELDRVAVVARQTLGFFRDTSTPTRVNVSQIIDEALDVYGYRLRNRDIELQKDLDASATIFSSTAEFRQVFSNLILNAVDAIPAAKGRIWVKVRAVGDWANSGRPGVRITVADNGSGISPEHMPKIFESFYTTKEEIGTGLGLWLTRNTVQKYQGRILVRSKTGPGRTGTVFSIFWPSSREQHFIVEAPKAS